MYITRTRMYTCTLHVHVCLQVHVHIHVHYTYTYVSNTELFISLLSLLSDFATLRNSKFYISVPDVPVVNLRQNDCFMILSLLLL